MLLTVGYFASGPHHSSSFAEFSHTGEEGEEAYGDEPEGIEEVHNDKQREGQMLLLFVHGMAGEEVVGDKVQ